MNTFVTVSDRIRHMPRPLRSLKNKPQARTEVTKTKILDAAQLLFAELGFENTQLDEVAARAGCSRGAIYAHYASKQELFLELMEQRVHTEFVAMRKKVEDEPDVGKRLGIFKRWISNQICEPSWGTLMLEFRLYAIRRPEQREELTNLYDKSLFKDAGKDLAEILFGKGLTKTARAHVERRLGILGGAINGIILESHFRPGLLPANHLRQLTEELFEALVHI